MLWREVFSYLFIPPVHLLQRFQTPAKLLSCQIQLKTEQVEKPAKNSASRPAWPEICLGKTIMWTFHIREANPTSDNL